MKAIFCRYHGPTATKPARISCFDSDKNRVVVSWDSNIVPTNHDLNREENYWRAVKALCRKMHWSGILAMGEGYGSIMVFVWVEPRVMGAISHD